MHESDVDVVGQTMLSEPQVQKIPKPFSIESLIASPRPSKTQNDLSNSEAINSNEICSNSNVPSNISVAAAAAAAAYNPWIHNYIMHQQKFLDLSTTATAAAAHRQAALPFGQSVNEMSAEIPFNLMPLPTNAVDRLNPGNLLIDREMHDKLLRQYFNVCDPKISGMFANASELYRNYNNFNAFPSTFANEKPNLTDANSVNDKKSNKTCEDRASNESENDEINENDLDSDCSSEVSLNLSRDDDNQGIED